MKEQRSLFSYTIIEYFQKGSDSVRYEIISERDKNLTALEQVLTNRGIKDIKHYLNTTDADLQDPLLLDNLREGAQMLIRHIFAGDPIYVQTDSDCDGYTSAALLINYLNALFPSFAQNKIKYALHPGKQHGIDVSAIPDGTKLVIAPDSSSNEYEIHKELREKGIDVLILDHHEAERVSENACVINNQLCDYPTKSLSGVGVVYKFCSYLDWVLEKDCVNQFSDLAALGILADVMPLTDFETVHIIRKGLDNLTTPFIKGMAIKNEYSIGPEVTPVGVAWYIAPYLNAVTRSGTPEEKLLLFESLLEFKALEEIPSTKRGCKGQYETRVEQALRTCGNIKKHQDDDKKEYTISLDTFIQDEGLLRNQVLFIQQENLAKSGLSGLIANELMGKHAKPVALLIKTQHEDEIWWEGSCRAPKGFDFKDFCQESGLVEYAEGHQAAFGLGIKDDNVPAFIELCNTQLAGYDFSPKHLVDLVYEGTALEDCSKDFYELMNYGHLWGQGVEEPTILIKNFPITKDDITLMKGTTLKLCKDKIPMIKFKSNEEEYDTLYSKNGIVLVDIVATCKKNEFRGMVTPQLFVKDYEIVNRMEYYF